MISEPAAATVGTTRTGGRLSGHIYEVVKARLLLGTVPSGGRLSVEALRSELGVSKQPIMDALRLLAADGLVEIRPQIGCVVASYSPGEVSDFFHMFAGLEGAVASVAARRCTPEALDHLEELSRRTRELGRQEDPLVRSRGYLELNRGFHEGIHRMAGSRIIAETSRRMWDLSDFLINTSGISEPMADSVDERQDDHDRIRIALAGGDAAAAKAEMEQHILQTLELIGEGAGTAHGLK